MRTPIRVPLVPKPKRSAIPLDEALRSFRQRWALLPAPTRVEALLPIIDALAEQRHEMVKQAARLVGTETGLRVPFMSRQYAAAAAVYEAFGTLVIALVEQADEEAGDAAPDVTRH